MITFSVHDIPFTVWLVLGQHLAAAIVNAAIKC